MLLVRTRIEIYTVSVDLMTKTDYLTWLKIRLATHPSMSLVEGYLETPTDSRN